MKETNLKGKIVWITGGKRIGQCIAVELAKNGAEIIVSYRSSREEAEEVAKKLKALGKKCYIVQCDVSKKESVAKAVSEIKQKFKKIDILVLLASVFKPVKLQNITEADFDINFGAHVKGTFWPIQASLPLMPAGSHIVAIADRTTLGRVYSGYLPYVVSKGAVSILVKALAPELGPKGIFINAIAPGPILRPDDLSQKDWDGIRNKSIVKYKITDDEAVSEFVQTVLRLCFVRSTGATYPLDLGQQ
jgi:NAD(P)-dependent dehydrogenase (short-subunit alcohol dehydrogenase family)